MLRMVKSGVPIVVGIVLAAVIGGALFLFTRGNGGGLGAGELERARRFVAAAPRELRACTDDALLARRTACTQDGYGDVDGDGLADCWREQRGDDHVGLATSLAVWRGCRGAAVTFEVREHGISLLVIPPALASPVWLRWIADRIAGPTTVACSGEVADCPAPGPEWEWILASADRLRAEPGRHGGVAPSWHTGLRPSSGALIVPHVPEGWMEHVRGPEEEIPEHAPAGARILVDNGGERRTGELRCGGLTVQGEPRGIVATDGAGRWAWLFRGLVDHGGFDTARLSCVDDLVIGSTGSSFASFVVIDPRTGGWLFEPGTDGGPGAAMLPTPDGDRLWRRDYGNLVSIRALHRWLGIPTARRPPLVELEAVRPELTDPRVADVAMVMQSVLRGDRPRDELYGDEVAASALPAGLRLAPGVTCGGWTVSSSPTTVLAQRAGRARWLVVEPANSWYRIAAVRCDGKRIAVERVGGSDLFEGESDLPHFTTQDIVIDLAGSWWSYHRRSP